MQNNDLFSLTALLLLLAAYLITYIIIMYVYCGDCPYREICNDHKYDDTYTPQCKKRYRHLSITKRMRQQYDNFKLKRDILARYAKAYINSLITKLQNKQ